MFVAAWCVSHSRMSPGNRYPVPFRYFEAVSAWKPAFTYSLRMFLLVIAFGSARSAGIPNSSPQAFTLAFTPAVQSSSQAVAIAFGSYPAFFSCVQYVYRWYWS